jgi:HrpA-like RNA helicase
MQEVQRQLINMAPLGIDYNDTNKYRIHVLHSTLPSISQQEVFEPLPDPGMRKIILATNIAETSITIQDVVHVVDSAKVKETNYDPTKRMTTLLPTWISASSLKQRAGRAGRVQEGQYFCMMSQQRRELLDAFSIPEMLRSDLQEICLHIKSVDSSTKIAGVLADAIQPPDQLSVSDALTQLTSLGALDRNENLTPLGRVLATLPVEPSFGRCLILSCVFRCLDPVLTLCASLGTKDIFVSPLMRKEQVGETFLYFWLYNDLKKKKKNV